ncbi:MAG TPA: type II toxin-antitoxin system VapB family antitoxin [Micromonosporaceae bacterium]|jgi:antitoxin VapB
MALNVKDAETERLAAEVAALANETKTGAIRAALRAMREQLLLARSGQPRGERLRRFLTDEAWPQVPTDQVGRPVTRDERQRILGYGPEGA